MVRCPTCGRPVASTFDHIDVDCHKWPPGWTMADLKIPEEFRETHGAPADINEEITHG